MAERKVRLARAPSRLLVIDASVLRAAGTSEHPTSSACRGVLIDILEICHRACDTPAIGEEWKRHQSNFARRWRSRMYARGKIKPPAPVDGSAIRATVRSRGTLTPEQIASIEKDLHLVEAALGADRIVVSADNRMRALLRELRIGALRGMIWANPVTERDSLQDFLSGAVAPPSEWSLLASS